MARVFGIIGALLILGGAAYAGVRLTQAPASQAAFAAAAVSEQKPLDPVDEAFGGAREVPSGFSEYRSVKYGFSLLHPASLKVSEFDEGDGAATITFEDAAASQGFQLFIVPHPEAQVSPARFKMDNPSGVRENLRDMTIDGAVGAAFDSSDEVFGSMSEVWFVHEGLLYEVTTLKPLESWMHDILNTWHFAGSLL